MSLRRLAVYLLLLPLAASCAGSGSTTTPPDSGGAGAAISAKGKLAKGVTGTCRLLQGEDGKDYSFSSSSIDSNFSDGERVCITGSPTTGFCMQGTQIELQSIDRCR
jgi:hypothetical protein